MEVAVNFDLSEDQQMLKALAERFILDHYDHDKRRAYQAKAPGFARENWLKLGELGLLAAPIAEEDGGLGLDATGIATLCEALGHGLVVEPFAESLLCATRLFAAIAPEALRAQWMDKLLDGSRRICLAHAEEGARDGHIWITTRAEQQADHYVLNGAKAYVVAGCQADGYIVSARLSGAPHEASEVGLFFVPADQSGLHHRDWPMVDGLYASSLQFHNVQLPHSARLQGDLSALAEIEIMARLGRTAEALGIMQRLFNDTLEYLKTREQFGTAIGSFQAIQHRMVAQYAAIEQSRALLMRALVAENAQDFAASVSGVRAYVAEASVSLGHEMIQFHGGMGVTDELAIGAGHKRLLMLSRWPENALAALDEYAAKVA